MCSAAIPASVFTAEREAEQAASPVASLFAAMAPLVAGASLAIATVGGTFVTSRMTGRIAHVNSAAVFISLLSWRSLWGVWGMLLCIPVIVIVKDVSQHVKQLNPMTELLGD